MQLLEKSRNELVAKSKNSRKGLERYKRRVKSRIGASIQEFNRIDMNSLFKDNILTISIKVQGETDSYTVKISFGGVLDTLKDELNTNKEFAKLDLRVVIRALVNAFNRNDVYVNCTCPDFLYRFSYVSTKGDYNSGEPQLIAADKTNPDDSLGSSCKHILLVLANTSWLIKTASVIKNYIEYMQKYRERLYQEIIYPAIYGEEYKEIESQQDMFGDELESDEITIDLSNKEARNKGKFMKNNPYRIAPNTKLKGQETVETVDTDEVIDDGTK